MSVPAKYYLDELAALKGAPKVTYPYGGYTYPRLERVYGVPKGRVSSQPLTVDGFANTYLVQVSELKRDQNDVQAYFRYDTLPGPLSVDISVDGETSIPILVARRKVLASTPIVTGEIVPQAVNVSAIATGAAPIVTVGADPQLPPGAWVTFAGTNSTPSLDGPQQIAAVLSPTQFTVVPASAVTVAGTAAGTVVGINRIIRELKPTENQLIAVQVESMICLPDITALNQNVGVWKDYSFPDFLEEVVGLTDESTTDAVYNYAYSDSGAIGLLLQNGYRGPCRARRLTFFSMGPPPDSFLAAYTPTFVLPSSGMAIIEGDNVSVTSNDSGLTTGITTSFSYRSMAIPPVLTRARSGVDSTVGSGAASFSLYLPASVPEGFVQGQTITLVEEPQKWRVGVWRTVIYQLTVPYTSGYPPGDFVYATNPASYVHGSAIATLSPTGATGAAGYAVSPGLPSGLSLDATTGAITGTPASATPTAVYTVTATLSGATITTYLTLTVT